MTTELPDLYACDECKLIGPKITALGHEHATGHVPELVSPEMAAGIREIWTSEGRSLIDGAEKGGSDA